MSRFFRVPSAALLLTPCLLVLCALSGGRAQQPKPKDLQWSHAYDLAVRKYGESDFKKDTQRFGIEAFRDANNGLGVYLTEKGGIALSTAFAGLKLPLGASKGPEWLTGLDLPARKAGQKEFTQETKVHSLEIFRDLNVNTWLYITEKGDLASAPAKATGSKNQAPKWVHSVDLSVRKGGVKDWKDATKFGIEVYRDGNTGNLIYVCSETGRVAVIPEATTVKGEGKAPDWMHGLDLSVRKANEPSFTKDTRKYGVEVYRDSTTGNLIFISEVGSLAVIPAPAGAKAPTENVKQPQWTHGLNVKVRAYGEKEFSEKTRVWGIEVFRDENIGATIYITEDGRFSAVATQ